MGDMSDLMDYLYDDIDTFCMGDYWEEGKHRTKNGDILEIKEMETSHIINTINYFSNFNTKPLEKELKKRGIKFTKKTKSKFKPYNSVIQCCPVCGKVDVGFGHENECDPVAQAQNREAQNYYD